MEKALAIVNADVHTMDPRNPRAEALLVHDGRVQYVGSESRTLAKARSLGARTLDARGNEVLPGLIDSHTHLVHQGLLRSRLDLRETKSLDQALRLVERALRSHPPSELLLAERWDESRWKEKRYPTRGELDELSATVPIVLRRVDGHIAVANHVACQLLRGRTPGVHEDTGLLIEEASLNLNQLFPTPQATSDAALVYAQDRALALGVTTVNDFVVPTYLRAYRRLHDAKRLKIRAHLSLYVEYLDAVEQTGIGNGWGDDQLRFAGIKLFGDGSLGGHTAALHEPYTDEDGHGRLNWTDEQLVDRYRRAHDADLQVSSHAIGDAAIDQAATAFKALGAKARKRRHRIEHFELHTPSSIQTLADLGLVASMQPNFVGEWSRPGGMYDRRLGSPRHKRNNEFRRILKEGVAVAFGSDCMPFDPWFGIEACIGAPYPSQRLRLDEALAAYTRGSAWGLGRERDLGMLRAGYQADFIVARLDARKPSRTRVLRTFVGGHETRTSATEKRGRAPRI